jgi:hypothetical protein
LENLVKLQWEMIDRIRELRKQSTYPMRSRAPTYPQEFYILFFRINALMRQILKKRDSKEEAMIVPEVRREIAQLSQELQELVQ